MAKLRCTMVADPLQGRTVNGIVNRYGYKVEDGEKVFGKIGEIDAQVDIQSFLESCDYRLIMDSLLAQFGSDFDFEPLVTMIQQIDLSDPCSVASYVEMLQDEFACLPKEIKEHYENNPRKFARDCIGGGAVDFINSFSVDNDGSQTASENAGEMAIKQGGVAAGNGQPNVAEIMRQIDAINAKLGVEKPGCDSGAEKGEKA